MNTERNQILVKALGLCWHEYKEATDESMCVGGKIEKWYRCTKCGRGSDESFEQTEFSTESSFFTLLEWLKDQQWYISFIERYGCRYCPQPVGKYQQPTMWMLPDYLLNPDALAGTIAEYLVAEKISDAEGEADVSDEPSEQEILELCPICKKRGVAPAAAIDTWRCYLCNSLFAKNDGALVLK